MDHITPQNFEFHNYLKEILHAEAFDLPMFIATEKDFKHSPEINYPYRSYFYVLALMHHGEDKIRIGFKDYELIDKTISFVGPGIIRQWENNDWSASNHTIFFQADFFKKPFYSNFLIDYPFFKPGAHHAINLKDEDYERALEFIKMMLNYKENPDILQGLLFSYLLFINQVYSTFEIKKGVNAHDEKATNRFTELLHTSFQQEKEVSFYADKMNTTPKYLSELLKKEVGRSAKQLIDEYIILEAKSLLKQTDMSIKEILYWLGFEDPSYFSKFFKRKVGITPAQYRGLK